LTSNQTRWTIILRCNGTIRRNGYDFFTIRHGIAVCIVVVVVVVVVVVAADVVVVSVAFVVAAMRNRNGVWQNGRHDHTGTA